MIIAVGFKVNFERAVQFRKWVNQIAKDYTIKGWAMDGKIAKSDVTAAKNYLSQDEMKQLNWLKNGVDASSDAVKMRSFLKNTYWKIQAVN